MTPILKVEVQTPPRILKFPNKDDIALYEPSGSVSYPKMPYQSVGVAYPIENVCRRRSESVI